MDEKTTKRIIEYYNIGCVPNEISLKDGVFYGGSQISKTISENKDKINFLTTKDISKILNISIPVAQKIIRNNKIKTLRNPTKNNLSINYRIAKSDFKQFLLESEVWIKYDYNSQLISEFIDLNKKLEIKINIYKQNKKYRRKDILSILKISESNMRKLRLVLFGEIMSKRDDNGIIRKEKYLTKDEVEEFIKIGRYKYRNKALLEWLEKN